MRVTDLIKNFSKRETLPIEIDSVIEAMRSLGVTEEIYIWKSDISEHALKGMINHWDWPDNDGTLHKVVDIYYGKSLSKDRQRLVACKELLHILDPEQCRVANREKFNHLVERIILPPEIILDPRERELDGVEVHSDRYADLQAVAILFPYACRELLKKPFKEGKITVADISKMACIPPKYVALVMNDVWEGLYPIVEKT